MKTHKLVYFDSGFINDTSIGYIYHNFNLGFCYINMNKGKYFLFEHYRLNMLLDKILDKVVYLKEIK